MLKFLIKTDIFSEYVEQISMFFIYVEKIEKNQHVLEVLTEIGKEGSFKENFWGGEDGEEEL